MMKRQEVGLDMCKACSQVYLDRRIMCRLGTQKVCPCKEVGILGLLADP